MGSVQVNAATHTGLRTQDPAIDRVAVDAAIAQYTDYYATLTDYGVHLRWWIARYSRGDSLDELREAFGVVAEHAVSSGELACEKYGANYRLFSYGPGNIGLFRDALVLYSLALCLGSESTRMKALLRFCERGDPLFETLVGALLPAERSPPAVRVYPDRFDGLYDAIEAPPQTRPTILACYLARWLEPRMNDFGFRASDKKIGFWCFEAAGVVRALRVDDREFSCHVHYPDELAAYRRT
jgi:hypothetical protein